MQTVDKAFELLGFFSVHRAEIGLSELARLAEFDKATTRRLLLALARHGVIEQDPDNRRYRLGPGLLRLARVRESTAPLSTIAAAILRRLVNGSGETAHLTVLAGDRLSTVAVEESHRSNRIMMEPGEVLPMHATASGLVVMAFSEQSRAAGFADTDLPTFTETTVTDKAELQELLNVARSRGYVINRGWYESDTCSVAAPYFDAHQQVAGAIAVAAPSTRFSDEEQATISALVLSSAAELTSRTGGIAPAGMAA